ncbi:hypothetical protein JG687_00015446 [Phytophthora cactorum]|uniref:Uncharacterized protein n=1 Tax=Phytophthora cactorum TaxID=29920 RepID=A0A8T1TTP8_9STRA|nr:hypothetical protein JG687_00015446 [Phytophthora cactorum]
MYKEFRVNLSRAQAVNVLHGKPVRLTHAQLNADPAHYFHPENYKKLVKAYESGKGTTLQMSHGEVLRTHQSGLSGSGFWNFLKDNWKPIASTVLDKVADIAAPETGGLSQGVRSGFKTLTGIGMATAEPRRSRRMKGGSFRLA